MPWSVCNIYAIIGGYSAEGTPQITMQEPVLRLNPWLEAGFMIFGLAANIINWRIRRDVNWSARRFLYQ